MDNKPKPAFGASYTNEVGDVIIPLGRLEEVGNASNAVFKRLPMRQWIVRAIEKGLHPAVAALIETIDVPKTNSYYPRLIKGLGI